MIKTGSKARSSSCFLDHSAALVLYMEYVSSVLCWFRFLSYKRQITNCWTDQNYLLTYLPWKQTLIPADQYGHVCISRTKNAWKRFSFNKMKIFGYPKPSADYDRHGLILIWLAWMLNRRDVLFWKYIPSIQCIMKPAWVLYFLPATSAFLVSQIIQVSVSSRFVLAVYYQSLQQFQFTEVFCFVQ